MIRELLFMLSGQPGALFVKKDNGQFEMCSAIADVGLCQSEKEIIKPLLKIGSNVAFLNEFAEDRKMNSLYLEVIKQSIAKCVTEFQEELLVIEVEILEGSSMLGVTGIHSKIMPHTLLLEYLKELVDAIKLQEPNCLLMDTIQHYRDHCGVSKIIATFQQIYNVCLKVLHKQLVSWLLFGKLLDPYNEFFIHLDGSKNFVINGEKIPNCLSVSLAQQVLFVGESVVALSEAQDLSEEDWEFMGKLRKIPFENIVEIIRQCRDQMARRLWNLVTEKDRLNRSLNMILNTFLMKKGDIFAYFIHQTESILDGQFTPVQLVASQFALQQRLMNSLKKYLEEEEAEIERLSVNIMPDVQGQGWERVFLEYKTEWPLGVLIFTSETMQTYNKIFRLLLNLRRIQLNLNGLWKNLVVLDKPVLELRWNLQHVLIHLSQYIQIDVIEVQKSIMDRQIDQCQDFDKFRSAHANFLVVIAAQTFLHVPAMQACFKDLIHLALKFCGFFANDRKEGLMSLVAELNLEFERLMQLLFFLLNGMYQQSSGTTMEPIAQLLLRLDFNYYLTEGLQAKSNRTIGEI
ncbi:hypothetical protein DAPPUDRAFT_302112 [Daphnia pulex]|uniref:Gamma-tubulin complex component n=1 Tax=Daphnia pulex TaxID=6669 RepID=E9GBD8_DAPPU|nr:hypothetical protein DAPPUDRAFT_302112 [Daphnia pulex]|eukprot:EFX83173.1 hypothetical protein DAPPUDRAFT_302112 [Daphnia pulex]